ncbi:hypothetical protein EDD85DRAFT_885027 [Armillaria nabsnona]|nr:hypothetical protein EDD85DRAFT_885027 [Armillaria nabsnona]
MTTLLAIICPVWMCCYLSVKSHAMKSKRRSRRNRQREERGRRNQRALNGYPSHSENNEISGEFMLGN